MKKQYFSQPKKEKKEKKEKSEKPTNTMVNLSSAFLLGALGLKLSEADKKNQEENKSEEIEEKKPTQIADDEPTEKSENESVESISTVYDELNNFVGTLTDYETEDSETPTQKT